MQTTTRPVSKQGQRTPAKAQTHHVSDAQGVAWIAFGLITGIALAIGKAGLIGDWLRLFFSNCFGHGAWIVPVLMIFIGGALIAVVHAQGNPIQHALLVHNGLMLLAVLLAFFTARGLPQFIRPPRR